MSQLFSTDTLPVSDRIDAWQWNAQQICGDCRIRLPKSSFYGAIEIRHVGGLRLTRFSSSPLSFWKWPSETANPDNRFCIVITQLAGIRRYVQNGSSVLLNPGDTTLIDSGRPWSSSCGTGCARVYLRVPRWMMENRLRLREIPIAQRISGTGGLGATLSRLSQSLYAEAERLKEDEAAAALDAYFQILSACLGRAESGEQRRPELRSRIQRLIEDRLSDPGLKPAEIAAAADISVRHLHRLFSNAGSTLGDCIRARRLEQCRNDLANPRLRSKTITEIAFNWGFSDSAHFSRCFRNQFGICPRTFRAQTGLKTWNCEGDQGVRDFLRTEIAELGNSKPN
ncbi:MAG: transcriptional regulator FeaR [Acidobacteriia bacterium]|nr:transcriptional regulator FeaR [Terriglobia bacterium]